MTKQDGSESISSNAEIARLAADIAYFDARLKLLGQPQTPYQEAQFKVCRSLQGQLIARLIGLRVCTMNEGIGL